MFERGVDLVSDGSDAFGEVHERQDSAASGPGQPAIQGDLAGLALGDEHVAQAFFEQVAAVQSRVGFGDPRQLLPLPVGEVVGVLPQRVAGALEPAGIAGGDADAVSVALGLPGATRLVPGLATHLVEGVGGPLDHMERVGALHRLWAALGDDLGDPVGLVGRYVADRRTTIGAEQVEETSQSGPVSTGRGPQQSTRIVINHDRQVAVSALIGNLVDADAGQSVQPIAQLLHVRPDPGNDRPDRAPGDPHQLGDRRLGALGHQPGNGLIEGQRVPRTMPGPRHMGNHHPVLTAADP